MTPEQKARVSMDALLKQARWHVCDMADANIHAARGVFAFHRPEALAAFLKDLPGRGGESTAAVHSGAVTVQRKT